MSFDPSRAADGLYSCGHALYTQHRFVDAATVFRAIAAAIPNDERGWLGLGACHEAIDQHALAIDLYRTGEELAASTRCAIARSRTLAVLGEDAQTALEDAAILASGNQELESMVQAERSRT